MTAPVKAPFTCPINSLSKSSRGIEAQLTLILEEGLSETGKLLKEIKQNLALADEDKSKTDAQMEELRTQLNRLETLSKLTGSKTSLTRDLLDKAIISYRQGKCEDAISKWEEVVARNPDKLDAKFFIEIAKDRTKEKQIHEEMKALLIQRKQTTLKSCCYSHLLNNLRRKFT